MVRDIATRASGAQGSVLVLMPTHDVEECDKLSQPAHDPGGVAAMVGEVGLTIKDPTQLSRLECHINDPAFADAALEVLGGWIADGTVKM
jgi:uncharacterized protein (UPF0261 family)